MADWPPLKNSAFTAEFPIYDNDGDLVSAAAGLDSEVSVDGGAFADSNTEATEIATASGVYKLPCNAAEMNGDVIATMTKTSTTNAKTAVCVMYTATRQLKDLAYPATTGRSIEVETDGMVHSDIKEWLGVAPLALSSQRVQTEVGAMGADVITSSAFAAGAIDAAAIADAAIDAATFAAGAIDAGAIAEDAIGASELATGAVEEIADQIWDELRSAHTGAGSFGEGIASVQGNVTGSVASVTGAVGSVTGAVGSVTGDVGGNVDGSVGSVTGAVGSVTGNVGGNVTGSVGSVAAGGIAAASFAAGAINAAAIADAAIDAATFAAGAVDAAALAADAANEIADALLSRDVDQVEASAPVHSLCTAILKGVSRVRDNAGTLEIYQTDGSTLHASQTITTDAGNDPIDELTAAS